MADAVVPTISSKPASEEMFGRKFGEVPCLKFCPEPRECWESLRAYKPAYYEPWNFCACPPVRVKMLDEKYECPYGTPNYRGMIWNKLTNLRMTDSYSLRTPDRRMYCTGKYKKYYCRPMELHILPHTVRCEGAHVCPTDPRPRDAWPLPAPQRVPLHVWHDGFPSLNYAEAPFPHNPVYSLTQCTKHPCEDLWNLPCVRRRKLPLPEKVCPPCPLPGGDCSVLLAHRPWDPCSLFFGGPSARTKHVRRLRREALGRKILKEARENPFPCGTLKMDKPWNTWSSVGGVYNPKRPPYNPVFQRAGIKSGLTLGQPYKKTLDF